MVIKSSRKSLKRWECKKGCKLVDKPCKHLEKLLPHTTLKTTKYEFMSEYKEYVRVSGEPISAEDYNNRSIKLEQNLVKLGLEEFRAELLMDHFIDGMSIREIVENRGYTSAATVFRLIKETVNKLRKYDEPFLREVLIGDK